MPWPNILNYGIEADPLIDSPFTLSSIEGTPTPPMFNEFLLLNGTPLVLLNGGDFLLLDPT
jgi:hypothetical protein